MLRVLKAPPPKPTFDAALEAWGSGFGGSNKTDGDAIVGSNNVTARTYGFAGGMDYRFTPDTVVGFALAGGGTNWGLAQGTGQRPQRCVPGRRLWPDAFRPGLCGGGACLHQQLDSTNRTALGDQLTATSTAQSFGGRIEAGYRYADAAIG